MTEWLSFTDKGNATTANSTFAISGVPCFADTFVQGGSSVLRMKFSTKTPPACRCKTLAARIQRHLTMTI